MPIYRVPHLAGSARLSIAHFLISYNLFYFQKPIRCAIDAFLKKQTMLAANRLTLLCVKSAQNIPLLIYIRDNTTTL
jgi:hypothetical protein